MLDWEKRERCGFLERPWATGSASGIWGPGKHSRPQGTQGPRTEGRGGASRAGQGRAGDGVLSVCLHHCNEVWTSQAARTALGSRSRHRAAYLGQVWPKERKLQAGWACFLLRGWFFWLFAPRR